MPPRDGGEGNEKGLFGKRVGCFYFMKELRGLLWKRVVDVVQSLVLTMEGISSSNEHQLVLIAASMKILIGRLVVGGYAGLLRVKKKSRLLVVEERFVCVMEK
jgi:hypothetical protein